MGLLPDVAGSLRVSEPEAGHLISAYALGVVVGAPMIALLAARASRRTMLLLLMVGFAVANLASGAAPGIMTLTVARFLSGLPHGGYFGVASLVAAGIARPDQRAQAVGRVLLGVTVATLIGTPLAVWLGQHFGWRSLFVLVGAIGALTVLLLWLVLPKDKAHDGASAARELAAFMRPQVLLTFAFAAIGFGGMFAVFTYIAATATRVAGLPDGFIPVILAIFGVGMITGMTFGSWLADRSLMKTLGGVLSFNVLVFATFALTAHHAVALCLMVFFIGCGAALAPAVQTRLMDVAGHAQTLAGRLHALGFQPGECTGGVARRGGDRRRLWIRVHRLGRRRSGPRGAQRIRPLVLGGTGPAEERACAFLSCQPLRNPRLIGRNHRILDKQFTINRIHVIHSHPRILGARSCSAPP
jgi:DHA1 family inner membrane transport protein